MWAVGFTFTGADEMTKLNKLAQTLGASLQKHASAKGVDATACCDIRCAVALIVKHLPGTTAQTFTQNYKLGFDRANIAYHENREAEKVSQWVANDRIPTA